MLQNLLLKPILHLCSASFCWTFWSNTRCSPQDGAGPQCSPVAGHAPTCPIQTPSTHNLRDNEKKGTWPKRYSVQQSHSHLHTCRLHNKLGYEHLVEKNIIKFPETNTIPPGVWRVSLVTKKLSALSRTIPQQCCNKISFLPFQHYLWAYYLSEGSEGACHPYLATPHWEGHSI